MESISVTEQNLRTNSVESLPVEDLLTAIEAGCPLYELGSGAYTTAILPFHSGIELNQRQPSNYLIKVVSSTSNIAASIDARVKRIGIQEQRTFVRPGLLHPSVGIYSSPSESDLALRAVELALEHQKHEEFMPGHVLPKQFAIINFPNPILRNRVSKEAGEFLARIKIQDISETYTIQTITYAEWMELFSGKEEAKYSDVHSQTPNGTIRGHILYYNRGASNSLNQVFATLNEDGSYRDFWSIGVLPGKQLVEIQSTLPAFAHNTTEGRDRVITWNIQSFDPESTNYFGQENAPYWDSEMAVEVTGFILPLLDMYKAGVSIDTTYNKQNGNNLLLMFINGRKRIITYDTNNWEVNTNKLAQGLGNTKVIFPGIKNSTAELEVMSLISTLLRYVDTANNIGLLQQVSDYPELRTNLDKIASALRQEVPLSKTVEYVNQHNKSHLDKIAELRKELQTSDGKDKIWDEIYYEEEEILRVPDEGLALEACEHLIQQLH